MKITMGQPTRRVVRRQDLPNLTGTKRTEPDPFLYCEVCRAHYSANAGDYWAVPQDHVFTCCEEPMRLVRQVTRLVDVELESKQ
jgi:hypothetical protein